MPKKVTVINSKGKERKMYLQGEGSAYSLVSPHKKSSWKTEKSVSNSSIKEFRVEKKDRDPNKEYFDVPQTKLSKKGGNKSSKNKKSSKKKKSNKKTNSKSSCYNHNNDDHFQGNTSKRADDWVSKCGGSDVPDYIEAGTAYFDEQGNYAGGSMVS